MRGANVVYFSCCGGGVELSVASRPRPPHLRHRILLSQPPGSRSTPNTIQYTRRAERSGAEREAKQHYPYAPARLATVSVLVHCIRDTQVLLAVTSAV